MPIEHIIFDTVRHLPTEQQQEVLDFAQFLVAKQGRQQMPPVSQGPTEEELDATLKEIRNEWMEELESMEKIERGETDAIA